MGGESHKCRLILEGLNFFVMVQFLYRNIIILIFVVIRFDSPSLEVDLEPGEFFGEKELDHRLQSAEVEGYLNDTDKKNWKKNRPLGNSCQKEKTPLFKIVLSILLEFLTTLILLN